jgi:tRNA pseudouridine55 synthase
MKNDNLLLIDKPAGMTSFGVVARVRRQLTEQMGHKIRVGHTGTLDPFATGLMIVLTGKETKNADKYSKLDKVYLATIRLGETSTTGDPEGEITPVIARRLQPTKQSSQTNNKLDRFAALAMTTPGKVAIENTLESFIGEIAQTPPIYSAIKINGQRAYKLARQGKQPKMPTRQVTIYDIKLIDYKYPELTIEAHCSSGTYIRTLAEDIGKKLGTGAYTSALRRLKVGDFDVEDALVIWGFSDTMVQYD